MKSPCTRLRSLCSSPAWISFRSETQPREVVPNRLNGATGPGIDQGGTRPLSLTQGRS